MTEQNYDVCGIGNAIVDVIAKSDDAFLAEHGLNKGAMTLLDLDGATSLYAKMPSGIESSGGSAGNTMAGVASFGGKGVYIGKVADDELGEVFIHDIRAVGVDFHTNPATDSKPTARCLILVTPDAQRTMNTYLGACVELGPDDVDDNIIRRSKVTYMEGYLWDPPLAKEAFIKAARIAHEAGQKVALSLSDSFCVGRHRDSFRDLVDGHIDILFANDAEIKSLYETDDFDAAVRNVREKVEIAALTRGAQGSVVVTPEEVISIEAAPVAQVVDTTGAGDLYAAGFLYGYTNGYAPAQWGQLGSLAAGEVISHYGARPEVSLAELAQKIAR
ncbi:MAG: adenosine kinase [Myxococcota bacterium]